MSKKIEIYHTQNNNDSTLDSLKQLIGVVERLRKECPWDMKQTHETLRPLLIEESYETIDAIDKSDWQELKKELGDLLLHIIFHSIIGTENANFDLRNVADSITAKLVERHPHVFGETEVANAEEVLQNWEKIKLKEKGRGSVLEGVPLALPSLVQAQRIQEKVAGVGFDFPHVDDALQKVQEEIRELNTEIQKGDSADKNRVEAEFGDLLFSLVNTARFLDISPEDALRGTNMRFMKRFRYIEKKLTQQGSNVTEATLEQMDLFWNEAKTLDNT